MDWLSWDLPYEGEAVLVSRAMDRQDLGDVPVDGRGVVLPGVTTVRPSEELDALRHRMHERGADRVAVTLPDGVLVGVVRLQ